jgi:hypothetical protein
MSAASYESAWQVLHIAKSLLEARGPHGLDGLVLDFGDDVEVQLALPEVVYPVQALRSLAALAEDVVRAERLPLMAMSLEVSLFAYGAPSARRIVHALPFVLDEPTARAALYVWHCAAGTAPESLVWVYDAQPQPDGRWDVTWHERRGGLAYRGVSDELDANLCGLWQRLGQVQR